MAVTAPKIREAAVLAFIGKILLSLLLVFFSHSALAEQLPSVPLTAEETALWRDAGFSATSGGEWQYYGFKPAEAREWLAVGIEFPGWANQWKSEGFRAGEAARWKELTNVYTAAGFLKAGFGPAEAKVWLDSGVQSSLRATEYRDLGMDAATGARFWQLAIYPDDAAPWFRAGFSPEETLAWRWGPKDVEYYHTEESPYSRAVYKVESAVEWRQAGFTAEQAHRLSGFRVELDEAKAWLAEGFTAAEILAWRDSGFAPDSARRYLDVDLPPAYAERAEFGEAWAKLDEIPELSCDLELLPDGRLKVLLNLQLINRPGGAYAEEFSLPLPDYTELWYGEGHYRDAEPAYEIQTVEVDGIGAGYRLENGRLFVPLPGDGRARSIRIAYLTDDRILYFPHHDELSFTALRDNPEVVIRHATLAVNLPPGADVIFTDGEAGLPGRKELPARVEESGSARRVLFEATRVLREKMGLRVNVAFTKGYVDPGWVRRFASLDHRWGRALTGLLLFLAGLALSSVYFLVVWHKYGRDPVGGGAQQQSVSPGSLIPAEARQFHTLGRVDGVSLLATIIHLAQKGTLTIAENGGEFSLRKEEGGMKALFPSEAALLAALFADGDTLALSGRPAGRRLKMGLRALRGSLRESFGNYYRSNLKYFFPGLAVSVMAVAAGVYSLEMDDFGRRETFRIFFGVVLSLAALVQLALFRFLLKAPTEEFSRQREALRGYRRYLETDLKLAKDLQGYLTPSQESHLAYSLALGLDLEGMAVRRGQARWFLSKSGPFMVGGFAAALGNLGRSFRA